MQEALARDVADLFQVERVELVAPLLELLNSVQRRGDMVRDQLVPAAPVRPGVLVNQLARLYAPSAGSPHGATRAGSGLQRRVAGQRRRLGDDLVELGLDLGGGLASLLCDG